MGIPFKNKDGDNLCFCKIGRNALLSSERVRSQIRQDHCLTFHFLYGMKHAGPDPPVKSARPLKEFVGEINADFQSDDQQDSRRVHKLCCNQLLNFGNYKKFCSSQVKMYKL